MAILSKSEKGHQEYMHVTTPTHVAHGHRALQMHGFSVQTYAKTIQSAITLIQRCESTTPISNLSSAPFCVPMYSQDHYKFQEYLHPN